MYGAHHTPATGGEERGDHRAHQVECAHHTTSYRMERRMRVYRANQVYVRSPHSATGAEGEMSTIEPIKCMTLTRTLQLQGAEEEESHITNQV